MMIQFKPLGGALLIAAAATLAGCQSSRLGALDTQPVVTPLPAAPTPSVNQGSLPPVSADQFPQAPVVAAAPDPALPTTTPSAPAPTAPAGGGAAVSKEALVGAWKVSTGGSSCQVFMALTQWTGGYRAASRGCPGDAAKIAAWDVSGSQVVLKDSTGNTVARLFSSGGSRYDGSTTGGAAISLAR